MRRMRWKCMTCTQGYLLLAYCMLVGAAQEKNKWERGKWVNGESPAITS